MIINNDNQMRMNRAFKWRNESLYYRAWRLTMRLWSRPSALWMAFV